MSTLSTPALSTPPQSALSKACHIQQDEVLELNVSEQAWQVRSGTVALCRTIDGIRRCFFTAHAGEVIFGVAAQDSGLVAIAIEPAVITAIP
ncbi:hypothetical protein IQ260_08565 [Leptolyngbya cf. ectocarpi LEGE 11479]|uniref:Uncharacterized protein n=1 Tax=Leptolyngbya cf. ectocarpi LEGE 11479 TaxID=1828722 RepID=A0A928ZRL0_LEPEC|nr:hypothetical protein [Leptolyngbya ectocarpi]MBE9066703.1 hypothetical protein [Leptolyngbya cf. ectocarpi LEGE 11479]